jgi:predicted translin family RNA/ssDNA-binding protein
MKKITQKYKELDIQGENFYRFSNKFSFAVQEFIEGYSLYEYLKTGELLKKEKIDSEFGFVSHEDYILGIADLSGELMRLATNQFLNGNR